MDEYRQGETTGGGGFSEGLVEDAVIDTFRQLGYGYLPALVIAPDGAEPGRTAYGDVLLLPRLQEAIARLNPAVPQEALDQAVRQLLLTETPSLVEENRRIHRLLTDGVDVEFANGDGEVKGDKVWPIDFEDPDRNDFLVTNQFTVAEGKFTRRADIVVFVNGLPLGVIELKNAASEAATIEHAFNQLQIYKVQIPSLIRTNAVLIASDGTLARIGSLTADEERFMPWRSITGAEGDFTPHGPTKPTRCCAGCSTRSGSSRYCGTSPSLATLARGLSRSSAATTSSTAHERLSPAPSPRAAQRATAR